MHQFRELLLQRGWFPLSSTPHTFIARCWANLVVAVLTITIWHSCMQINVITVEHLKSTRESWHREREGVVHIWRSQRGADSAHGCEVTQARVTSGDYAGGLLAKTGIAWGRRIHVHRSGFICVMKSHNQEVECKQFKFHPNPGKDRKRLNNWLNGFSNPSACTRSIVCASIFDVLFRY